MDDSFQWHNRALNHLLATSGHRYTAHPCVGVAELLLRRAKNHDASSLLDQAIRIYKMHPEYKDDLARAYFSYARLMAGNAASASRAVEMLNSAADCLNAIYPHAQYQGSDLKDEHSYGLGTVGLS